MLLGDLGIVQWYSALIMPCFNTDHVHCGDLLRVFSTGVYIKFPQGDNKLYHICIHMQHIGDSFPTRAVWNGGDITTGSSR